jgi:transposase
MVDDNVLIKLIEEKFDNQEKQFTAKFNAIDDKLDTLEKNNHELKESFEKDNHELKESFEKDNYKLKESFEKETDGLKAEIKDIKENHLHSIDVRLSKIERDHKWIELFLVILIGLLLKQIFFP